MTSQLCWLNLVKPWDEFPSKKNMFSSLVIVTCLHFRSCKHESIKLCARHQFTQRSTAISITLLLIIGSKYPHYCWWNLRFTPHVPAYKSLFFLGWVYSSYGSLWKWGASKWPLEWGKSCLTIDFRVFFPEFSAKDPKSHIKLAMICCSSYISHIPTLCPQYIPMVSSHLPTGKSPWLPPEPWCHRSAVAMPAGFAPIDIDLGGVRISYNQRKLGYGHGSISNLWWFK